MNSSIDHGSGDDSDTSRDCPLGDATAAGPVPVAEVGVVAVARGPYDQVIGAAHLHGEARDSAGVGRHVCVLRRRTFVLVFPKSLSKVEFNS